MSPASVCFSVTKAEAGNLATVNAMQSTSKLPPLGFQFGIHRRPQDNSKLTTTAQCLKVSKESHRIRKPPLPLPQVQYRPPVIIHTYSPKVIHTEPDDFMSLVQKLTGSSDTRLRLKRSPGSSRKKQLHKKADKTKNGSNDDDDEDIVNNNDTNLSASGFTEDPEHQGSGITSTTNCGSPSSSEDSAFPGPYSSCSDPSMQKQSDSPRGPLSANCDFLNTDPDAFFSSFDGCPSPANIFSNVKSEPSSFGFSFGDTSSFNFFSDFPTSPQSLQPFSSLNKAPKSLPRPPTSSSLHHNINHHDMHHNSFGIDINSPLPSPGFLSPGLLAGLPDLSPSATAAWSQSFLECVTGPPPQGISQPLRRQRFGGYSPAPADQSPMVSLESIQAFMLS